MQEGRDPRETGKGVQDKYDQNMFFLCVCVYKYIFKNYIKCEYKFSFLKKIIDLVLSVCFVCLLLR